MKSKLILITLICTMFFVGVQAAQPASATTKIDQFFVVHPGGGQSGDADLYKIYKINNYNIMIYNFGYNYNKQTHKYVKNGANNWLKLHKHSPTQLYIVSPKMEGNVDIQVIKTRHSAEYYYWFTMKKELNKG